MDCRTSPFGRGRCRVLPRERLLVYTSRRNLGILILLLGVFVCFAVVSDFAKQNPGTLLWNKVLFCTVLFGAPGVLLVYSSVRGARRARALVAWVGSSLEREPTLMGGTVVRRAASQMGMKEKTVRKILAAAEGKGDISIPGTLTAPFIEGTPSPEVLWLWSQLRKYAIPFNGLRLGSDISTRQMANVGSAFPKFRGDGIPLALVDTSVTSSGKEGLLVTSRGIHWKRGDETGFRSFEDLPQVVALADRRLEKWIEIQGIAKLPVALNAPPEALERLAEFLNRVAAQARGEPEAGPEPVLVDAGSGEGGAKAGLPPEDAVVSEDSGGTASGKERFHECVVQSGAAYCECPNCGAPTSWLLSSFAPRSREVTSDLRRTDGVFRVGRPIVGMSVAWVIAIFVALLAAAPGGKVTTWTAIAAAGVYILIKPFMVRALMRKLPVWEATCPSCGGLFELAVREPTVLLLEASSSRQLGTQDRAKAQPTA